MVALVSIRCRMPLVSLVSIALAALGGAACGAPKPASAPEAVVGASDGKSDMPDMPSSSEVAAEAPSKKDESSAPRSNAGPGGGMLRVAPMTWSWASKANASKRASAQVAKDGTVTFSGKVKAKISGDQVQDEIGMTLVTVGIDGSLVGSAFKTGQLKFEGDDLVGAQGDRLTVGDDGTVTSVKMGKKPSQEIMGKFEGSDASSKRAALLVYALMTTLPELTKLGPSAPTKR